MSSERRRFRPLSVSDILDETVDIYKSNFVLLLGVAAILYIPMTLISGLTQNYSGQSGFDWRALLQFLPEAIVTGALTFGISERYLGRYASIADCYRRILNKRVLLPLLGAMLIKYAITLTPFFVVNTMMQTAMPANPNSIGVDQAMRLAALALLLLASAIWMLLLGVKLMLVEPSLIMESRGALSSIKRSWSLMKGYFWKAVGLYMIVGFVMGIVYAIIVLPAMTPIINKARLGEAVPLSLMVLPTILQTIVVTLTIPLMAATRILYYYDVRIRKEGFDLELLANELDHKAQQSAIGEITSLPQEQVGEPASDGEQQ